MATNKEVLIDDDELNSLMAELEEETAGMVAAPTLKPVVVAPPEVEAVIEAVAEVVATAAAPEEDLEAQMAALEAELEASCTAIEKAAKVPTAATEPVPTPKSKPKPAPAPEPELEPDELESVHTIHSGEDALVEAMRVIDEKATDEICASPPLPPQRVAGLQFFIDAKKFIADHGVSLNNLDKCMMEQSGLRAFYGEQAARAEGQFNRIRMRFDVIEAQLYDAHRKALQLGPDKVTEKAVENAVKLDPKWARNKNTVIEAETIATINRSIVDALRDRVSMIMQLGADRREEFKGGARTMASDDAHASVRDRALAISMSK